MSRDAIAALRALSDDQRRAWLAQRTTDELIALRHYWPLHARPEQLAPPGEWTWWLCEAGRGWGKTRTGAEYIIEGAQTGRMRRAALVARTAGDVRDVVVEGESGILACSHPSWRPVYEPSKRRLTWPSGARATTYSADKPDQLRGPQHDLAWCDELAAWRYPEAWTQLRMGLRLGSRPRCVITTTPRPTPVMRALRTNPRTVRVTGSTFANAANLAPEFLAAIREDYEGTRLGRQELYAEVLDDIDGALWRGGMIDDHRVQRLPCEMRRVVVAVDPATTATRTSDETGIVTAAIGENGQYYILDDASGRYSPDEWARKAVVQYHGHSADRLVAECNQGGDMVGTIIRGVDASIAYTSVHARRGKYLRAEPIAALYEQGRVHHVGYLADLESQMTTWVPGEGSSPDRVDALVYALTSLHVGAAVIARPGGATEPSKHRY